MASRIALVVCRHLAEEAAAVCRACHWDDVSVAAVAPRCERAWENWTELMSAAGVDRLGADMVAVVGAGCLPDGSPAMTDRATHVVRKPTCFALLTNESLVDAWTAGGSYLVTPGWLAAWRTAVEAWGYDQGTARQHFGEFARSVRLLDTGASDRAAGDLRDFAGFLGLEALREPVGTDVFAGYVKGAVLDLRTTRQVEDALVQSAESTMLLDLSAELMDIGSETNLLTKIAELVRTLLPPSVCRAASVRHGQVEHVTTDAGDGSADWVRPHLRSRNALTMLPDDQGFVLQLRHRDDVVGIIEVTRISMPENIPRYANAVSSLGGICGAAIVRCRALAGILSMCSGCKRVHGTSGWEPVDVYLRSHSDVDFSHGLCPDCLKRLYPDVRLE
jgi:hypothetical protein